MLTAEKIAYIKKVRNCVPLVNCDSGAGVSETQRAIDDLLDEVKRLQAKLVEAFDAWERAEFGSPHHTLTALIIEGRDAKQGPPAPSAPGKEKQPHDEL